MTVFETRILALTSRRRAVALACLACVPLLPQPAQGRVQVLDTPGFTISVEVKCPEGEVTCKDVSYRGESKRTKRSVNLKGNTAHSVCADKVTSCRFLGYVFRSGTFS